MNARSFLLALLFPSVLLASQEPPPVTLSHRVSGPVEAGRPFLVHVTVANAQAAVVAGTLKIETGSGVEVAGHAAGSDLTLPARARRTVVFPLTARSRGANEFDVVFASRREGRSLAVLRLFARLDDRGGAILTLPELIEAQASAPAVGAAGRNYLLFRLRSLDRPTPVRRHRATDATVSGQIFYTGYRGEQVPGHRLTAELWSEAGRSGQVVSTAQVSADGRFTLTVPGSALAGRRLVPTFTLATPRWAIQGSSRRVYAWQAPALTDVSGSVDIGTLQVPAGQAALEACWIHTTLNRVLDLYERHDIDISWWPRVPVTWPASGDYFSWGGVNLTKAFQWDVVGHEFGHAIFHHGTTAVGGGGMHKIDECYTRELAWSEGWASYFAAVVSLARDDEDARFEFMVPRRAPIRVENVPGDVCRGQTNEWRVAAALWDIYDTHADGDDGAAVDFPGMWAAMRDGDRVSELLEYVEVLRKRLSTDQVEAVNRALKANTITP